MPLLLLVAAACAEVERRPSPLTPALIPSEVGLSIGPSAREATGFPDVFLPGSRWQLVGRIAEGEVLRPLGGGLGVTGVNVREGYAVIRDGRLVGFWLPVEEAFSPAGTTVPMSFD